MRRYPTPFVRLRFLVLGVGSVLLISNGYADSISNRWLWDDPGAPVARVVYKAETTPAAPIDVDVFWCSDDQRAGARAIAASQLAASWATISSLTKVDALRNVAEIRTRPINKKDFLAKVDERGVKEAQSMAVMTFDQTNDSLKYVGSNWISEGLTPTALANTKDDTYTPNYISAYVCPNIDQTQLGGQVYFQIKDKKQTSSASDAIELLAKSLPGLTLKGIEVVGERAPKKSEVRFFHDEDGALAAQVAGEISRAVKTDVVARQVPGFETTVKLGTLEAWISP